MKETSTLPDTGYVRTKQKLGDPKAEPPILPATGYVRIKQILGDPKAEPPIPPVIPVGKSTWWAGIKSGIYPKPVKLGPKSTAWRVDDIRALMPGGANEGEPPGGQPGNPGTI